MDDQAYDLLIIGGGPTGLNVGISARKAGLRYLIIEKGMLANSLFHFPVNMTFFSTSLKLEIHNTPFISHGDKPTRSEALEYYRRLAQANGLHLHLYEEVLGMEPRSPQGYTVRTSKATYHARAVCVATGFYDTPRLLGVPGEDLPKVKHYYDDPHAYINQEVLVVGAANSACDAALECWRKGARVTMAIRGDSIYDRVKYWIRPDIENRIKEGSITAHFNTTVTAIHPASVDLNTPAGPLRVANDFVLAMTGYLPNYALFERLGLPVETDDACKPIFDPETLQTQLPGVYLAGVACAGQETSKLFIENTRDHGERIIIHLQAK
ncbi:YpdA family putative bacillithiol disulfide reductase [Neolewinella lacunae]|uniref:YpdA family putative bacillithiol disulfide reductase n=1 Tax=Neolewinella lacunae TaxID=1517758 RepID=A0A923PM02_9BACT|nr:YpdA family putative bacillithiol disulfide reductase [Neolewinella lacunae]MBC6993648.1 YpdA family putative bacillithiol disulfide reductase [Neolewinella lacunae]MDN3634724.1 YpdA family putative bacillithiol disulfide reductase [Neolewinella lacunae]